MYNPINKVNLPFFVSYTVFSFIINICIIYFAVQVLPVDLVVVIFSAITQIYFVVLGKVKELSYDKLADIKKNKKLVDDYLFRTFGIFLSLFYILSLSIDLDTTGINYWSNVMMPLVSIIFYILTIRTHLKLCYNSNLIIFNTAMKDVIECRCINDIDNALNAIIYSHPLDPDLFYNDETKYYYKHIKLHTVEDENGKMVEEYGLNIEFEIKENENIIKSVTYETIMTDEEDNKMYKVTNYSLYNYRVNIQSQTKSYGNIYGPDFIIDSWLLNYDRSENENKFIQRFMNELKETGIDPKMLPPLNNMYKNSIYGTRIFYFASSILNYKRLGSLDSIFTNQVQKFNDTIVNLLSFEEFDSFRKEFLDKILYSVYRTSNFEEILKIKSNKTGGRKGELTRYQKLFMDKELKFLNIDRVNNNFKITE